MALAGSSLSVRNAMSLGGNILVGVPPAAACLCHVAMSAYNVMWRQSMYNGISVYVAAQ